MRLRIAQLAPPFETVPPSRYGGTERVIATLTEELVRRGHEVTLFAAGDSHTSAHLVPIVERALWHHDPPYRDFVPFWSVALGKILSHLDSFDVIHSHLDHFGFPLSRIARAPVVTTLHGRLDLPELAPLFEEYRDVPLVSISHAQRTPVPEARWIATVHHGIEVDEYTFNPDRGSYLAFLGRISPEKGLDTAIRVARRAGMPLKIAARMPLPFQGDPNSRADWDYYENVVQPLLEGPQVELIGQVGGAEKDTFLRNAAALLFPIRWPEPFGLVMVEAMACGTPVLALRDGSVPEVVEDGVTGFVCGNEDALVEAVRQLGHLDRAICRAEAERRFSPAAMTDRYEAVYAALGGRADSAPGGSADANVGETALWRDDPPPLLAPRIPVAEEVIVAATSEANGIGPSAVAAA